MFGMTVAEPHGICLFNQAMCQKERRESSQEIQLISCHGKNFPNILTLLKISKSVRNSEFTRVTEVITAGFLIHTADIKLDAWLSCPTIKDSTLVQ